MMTATRITLKLQKWHLAWHTFSVNTKYVKASAENPEIFTKILTKRLPKSVKASRRVFLYDDSCNLHKNALKRDAKDISKIRIFTDIGKIIRDVVNPTIAINIIISNKSTRRFVSRKIDLWESCLLLLLIVLSKITKQRWNCSSSWIIMKKRVYSK